MATAKKNTTTTGKQRSASNVIKRTAKREAQYQIADIKRALQMAKNPDMPDRKKILEIFEYILKDGHLKSQIRTAKIKVLSEPWLLYNGETPEITASQLLAKRWFGKIIEYILFSEFYAYTLVECDEYDPANWMLKIKNIDREYVSIEKQWILIDGTISGDNLPYGDIKEQLNLLQFGDAEEYGSLVEAAYNVIFKFYSRSDWSRGSEKFGMPILNIEADTNNDTELDRLEKQAANFGSDGYIVTQKGDKATIIERQGQNIHLIWKDNIAYCDEQISKIINGQTATSDTKAFVGSAEVQERTMEDFTQARLQNIVDEMNENVLPFLRLKGFSIADGLRFDYPELIRARKRKIEGPPVMTATPDEPEADKKDKDKKQKDKKQPIPKPAAE